MGHPLRLVEGAVSTRPIGALGNAAFNTASYAAEVDREFDLGGLRKDIHIENNRPITVKVGLVTAGPVTLGPGAWDFTEEFAEKVFITFAQTTELTLYANG